MWTLVPVALQAGFPAAHWPGGVTGFIQPAALQAGCGLPTYHDLLSSPQQVVWRTHTDRPLQCGETVAMVGPGPSHILCQ